MKLAVSNIAWDSVNDNKIYNCMKAFGFTGLEIAPTRIFPDAPYDCLKEAKQWKESLLEEYGFCVPSMQSIWFGRQENIFGPQRERDLLILYTEKAIDFASEIDCGNLVFGCPKNRNIPEGGNADSAVPFFTELGDYAKAKGTVIGMEANPRIYNTNYINDTPAALELIREVDSDGFKLNLDVGTMIQNNEAVEILRGQVSQINHVHISEPHLKPIEKRTFHQELADLLIQEKYQGFVSIEMGKVEDVTVMEEKMKYIQEVFG